MDFQCNFLLSWIGKSLCVYAGVGHGESFAVFPIFFVLYLCRSYPWYLATSLLPRKHSTRIQVSRRYLAAFVLNIDSIGSPCVLHSTGVRPGFPSWFQTQNVRHHWAWRGVPRYVSRLWSAILGVIFRVNLFCHCLTRIIMNETWIIRYTFLRLCAAHLIIFNACACTYMFQGAKISFFVLTAKHSLKKY